MILFARARAQKTAKSNCIIGTIICYFVHNQVLVPEPAIQLVICGTMQHSVASESESLIGVVSSIDESPELALFLVSLRRCRNRLRN